MASRSSELGRRIRELRRRHFGPRGKATFAQRLGIAVEEYERYERGVIPDGGLLVRMCEITGEDLQWLLTGVASRATLVISGARGRHQQLLARIAEAIDRDPALARPIEALLELLQAGREAARPRPAALPNPQDLIPVLEPDELPQRLDDGPAGVALPPAPPPERLAVERTARWRLAEPDSEPAGSWREVELVVVREASGGVRSYVRSPLIAQLLDRAFAVRWSAREMEPMIRPDDLLVVWPQARPSVARPALVRLRDPDAVTCGIWLGERAGHIHLGRLDRSEPQAIERGRVCWSRDVLYRLRALN